MEEKNKTEPIASTSSGFFKQFGPENELFKAIYEANQEEEYLGTIAKAFTQGKHRNFLNARGIILSLHLKIDSILSILILDLFFKAIDKKKPPN